MSYSVGFSQSLEILFYIELKSKKNEYKYLTIQQISNKLNIPVPSVKRLVGLLKKANFIDSKKGANGGLALAVAPKDICVYDVFIAIEGNVPMFKSYENFTLESFQHDEEAKYMLKKSKEIFNVAEQAMYSELKQISLNDFFY